MPAPTMPRTTQKLVMVRKKGGKITEDTLDGECTFVPLLGRFAWRDDS